MLLSPVHHANFADLAPLVGASAKRLVALASQPMFDRLTDWRASLVRTAPVRNG